MTLTCIIIWSTSTISRTLIVLIIWFRTCYITTCTIIHWSWTSLTINTTSYTYIIYHYITIRTSTTCCIIKWCCTPITRIIAAQTLIKISKINRVWFTLFCAFSNISCCASICIWTKLRTCLTWIIYKILIIASIWLECCRLTNRYW